MIAYTKLKLLRGKYDKLTNDRDTIRRKNVLVFQFTYPLQSSNYPILKAYEMQNKHQHIPDTEPVNLIYADATPGADLSQHGEQVTGDLQIKYSDIEKLKKDSNPDNEEKYDYLLFTPKFNSTNYHIYFEVSVVPHTNMDLTVPTSINPSPPAGAK